MAKSKLVNSVRELTEDVVEGYQKIEDGVVGSYKKIEEGVVEGFDKMVDNFVDNFLTRDGETVEEARERLSQQRKERME